MKYNYDIIVIGGGHNGLTTASLLAKKGKKVLLLEKRAILGGLGAGEAFFPGYRTNGLLHDTSCVRVSVLRALGLEKYGLKLEGTRPGMALLSKKGKGIFLPPDPERAAREIAKFSEKDGAAYIEYRAFIRRISGFINDLMNEILPDLANLNTKQLFVLAKKGMALKRLGKKTMLELLKVGPMSVADFLNEKFETDFLKAGIAGPAIFASYAGPHSSYTTLNLLLWECCAMDNVIGGPQALISALEKAAVDSGVEIRTGVAVEKILLDNNGKVEGIRLDGEEEIKSRNVAASCTPRETFFRLLTAIEIGYSLEHGIQHFRSRGTTAKVNLALNRQIDFNCDSDSPVRHARTGNTFDEMEKAFDPVKYRQFSEEPVLDIHVPTIADPGLAPKGHSVFSVLVHFAPHHFDAGWTKEQKELLGDKTVATLEKYLPGISNAIVAREVISPLDLEQQYGLTQGHVYHGEHAVDQLIARPIASCAQYETPIPGLYLCGSGSFPGGGITCAPGALAAKVILKKT